MMYAEGLEYLYKTYFCCGAACVNFVRLLMLLSNKSVEVTLGSIILYRRSSEHGIGMLN